MKGKKFQGVALIVKPEGEGKKSIIRGRGGTLIGTRQKHVTTTKIYKQVEGGNKTL